MIFQELPVQFVPRGLHVEACQSRLLCSSCPQQTWVSLTQRWKAVLTPLSATILLRGCPGYKKSPIYLVAVDEGPLCFRTAQQTTADTCQKIQTVWLWQMALCLNLEAFRENMRGKRNNNKKSHWLPRIVTDVESFAY